MNYEVIYGIVKKMYCEVLKDEVHKLVQKSDSKIDNVIADVLDRIFECE